MRYRHIDNVAVSADFSTEGGVRFRYQLEVRKAGAPKSLKTVCFVMQNPSYAGEEDADKSVQFLERYIFEHEVPEFRGVGRLIVVNQFARVQTNGFCGLLSDIGSRNDHAIATAVEDSEIVVIAWGSSNCFHARKEYVLDLLKRWPGKRFYQTKRHPSRGRYADFIMPLEI